LGIGDWGLGIGPNPQSPIPNPQSPIPNPQFFFLNQIEASIFFKEKKKLYNNLRLFFQLKKFKILFGLSLLFIL
jgi:hypothetical protein